jgi:predicted DNA-binding transcriptional regulator AlpA
MGNSVPHNYARISEALISSGYTSLDEQAKALGLGRSTAWNIIKHKHKLGRLSAKTIDRILKNSKTPPIVRAGVEQYLFERPAPKVENRNQRRPQRSLLGSKGEY